MTSNTGTEVAAVILAGGRGSRLGGVRKAELTVGGTPLLTRVLAATTAAGVGATGTVVVGFPDLDIPAGVGLVQEDPPGSGPAAAVAAGWDWLDTRSRPRPDWVLALACDLPDVGAAITTLITAAGAAPAHIDSIFAQAGDRVEWLTGIHRWAPLTARIHELRAGTAGVINCSMRRLFTPLAATTIPAPTGSTDDIDTWEDHTLWELKEDTT